MTARVTSNDRSGTPTTCSRSTRSLARPRRFTKGLRFIASDLPWEHGTGPEVHGQAEALALAMVGRASVLDDLEGDGVDVLRARMSHNGNGPFDTRRFNTCDFNSCGTVLQSAVVVAYSGRPVGR